MSRNLYQVRIVEYKFNMVTHAYNPSRLRHADGCKFEVSQERKKYRLEQQHITVIALIIEIKYAHGWKLYNKIEQNGKTQIAYKLK